MSDVVRWCFLNYETALAGGIEEALNKAKILFEAEEGHLRCAGTPTEVKKALLAYKLPDKGWSASWYRESVSKSVIHDE
jgi:hypothetical protein